MVISFKMKMLSSGNRVRHPVHTSYMQNIKEQIKFHPIKGDQNIKSTICKRNYYFGFSDEEILLCLISTNKGKHLGYKVIREDVTKEVDIPDIISPLIELEVIKHTTNEGEKSLFVHSRATSEIWKLRFDNRDIRDQWTKLLDKKKSEDMTRSMSNAEVRVTEFEPYARNCQSVSVQITKNETENKKTSHVVQSAINLGELKTELTIDHKLPQDSMKAKLAKMLKSSIDRDKIVDFLATTFSELFSSIKKMKIQLRETMEERNNLNKKLDQMQKKLQDEKALTNQLTLKLKRLQQLQRSQIYIPSQSELFPSEPMKTILEDQEPSLAYEILNVKKNEQPDRSSFEYSVLQFNRIYSNSHKDEIQIEFSVIQEMDHFVEYQSIIEENQSRISLLNHSKRK